MPTKLVGGRGTLRLIKSRPRCEPSSVEKIAGASSPGPQRQVNVSAGLPWVRPWFRIPSWHMIVVLDEGATVGELEFLFPLDPTEVRDVVRWVWPVGLSMAPSVV